MARFLRWVSKTTFYLLQVPCANRERREAGFFSLLLGRRLSGRFLCRAGLLRGRRRRGRWPFALQFDAQDLYRRLGFVLAESRHTGNLCRHVLAVNHLAEYRMLAIQMRRRPVGDEKLRAAGVRLTDVGHGKTPRDIELERWHKLVGDGVAGVVIALSGGVAGLDHEARDHAVKCDA